MDGPSGLRQSCFFWTITIGSALAFAMLFAARIYRDRNPPEPAEIEMGPARPGPTEPK